MSIETARVLVALEKGMISKEEADRYLQQMHGITLMRAMQAAKGEDAWILPVISSDENVSVPTGIPVAVPVSAPSAGPIATVPAPSTASVVPVPAGIPFTVPVGDVASSNHIADAGGASNTTGTRIAGWSITHGSSISRNRALMFAVIIFIALSAIGFLFLSQSIGPLLPAGRIVLDAPHIPIRNTTIAIDREISGLTVSGVLRGEGIATVWFDTQERAYLVATISSDDGSPRTDKANYAAGELVMIDHAPLDASYYLDDGTTSVAVSLPFVAPASTNTLLIVANESGILTTYRVPIVIGDAVRTTSFTALCHETCDFNSTNGTLRVEITGDAVIEFSRIEASVLSKNSLPVVTTAFGTINVNDAIVVNLSMHITDPDGDELFYSTGASPLVAMSVSGTMLSITPVLAGSGTITVYASDLKNLTAIPIDIVVTVRAPDAVNATALNGSAANVSIVNVPSVNLSVVNVSAGDGSSLEHTANVTAGNGSDQTPSNTTSEDVSALPPALVVGNSSNTNGTGGNILDCSNADLNLRPTDCLNLNATKYFEEDILLENEERATVGRITEIGNLLITGKVIKHDAAGVAGARDFNIGYKDADFNYHKTVWIDGQGNLHLRGDLYEENNHLVPPAGSYSISNRRGIYLLYADQMTGDIFVRGNIIPYRESVQ